MHLKIIKLLLPTLLLNIVRYWRGFGLGYFSYNEYGAALRACGSNAYSDSELVDSKIIKCISFNNNINTHNQNIANTSIIALYHLINERSAGGKNIHFVDLGGGGGHVLPILRSLNQDTLLNIKCTVVETALMAERATKLIDDNRLIFVDSLAKVTRQRSDKIVDIVYANSSIQYFDDVRKLLNDLLELDSKYILIARSPFLVEGKTFYKVQRSPLSSNGPCVKDYKSQRRVVKYPICFFNVKEFELLLLSKYKLVYCCVEPDSTFNTSMDNIELRTYLFERKVKEYKISETRVF